MASPIYIYMTRWFIVLIVNQVGEQNSNSLGVINQPTFTSHFRAPHGTTKNARIPPRAPTGKGLDQRAREDLNMKNTPNGPSFWGAPSWRKDGKIVLKWRFLWETMGKSWENHRNLWRYRFHICLAYFSSLCR